MDWRTFAACLDEDPDLFFPVGASETALAQAERAKRVCRRCPVIAECREQALRLDSVTGVWGGLSEQELVALRRTLVEPRRRRRAS